MTSRPHITPVVGRTDELASFARAVEAARAGVPQVVLVAGEAGIGKSALVVAGAAQAGVPLYLGRSARVGGAVIPLSPLADLLRQLTRSAPDALEASAVQGAPLAGWFPAPDAASSMGRAPVPSPTPPTPEAVFVAVLDLLATLGSGDGGAAVVALEDMHWADALTWDLLGYVARSLVDERVVLVATYRPEEVRTDPEKRRNVTELMRVPVVQRFHLGGLDREGVGAQVAALRGEAPPWELVEEVFERGRGNPFFTEQLVAAHDAGEAIPLVLVDLISADVAALDGTSREFLTALAVLGRPATHSLLSAVLDLADDAVEHAVRVAIAAGMVVVDENTDAYRVRHGLIGEVVYAELLPPQRARLHRRVATALSDLADGTRDRADATSEIALHLDRGGQLDDAFVALLRAADVAEPLAPAAALRHLERALELWDRVAESGPPDQRCARLWQAAELASGVVGNARAVELARQAFQIGPPPLGEAFGHERLGRYLWASGQPDDALVEFERAAALLPADAGPEAAPVLAGLAQSALMSGHDDAAARWCGAVLALVPDAGDDPSAWGMAHRVRGMVHSRAGDAGAALSACRAALSAAVTVQQRALAQIYLGVALLDAGRYVEAVDIAAEALEAVRRSGLERSFGGYLDAVSAEGLMHLGQWDAAETQLARHRVSDALPMGALRVACVGARVAARRGNADLARDLLADAQAQPADGLHTTYLAHATAEVHLLLSEWASAHDAAERGWASTFPGGLLWDARFALLATVALVEQSLDLLARRQPADVPTVVARLGARLAAVRAAQRRGGTPDPSRDVAAHLAHAAATISRLTGADPDAWAEAARRWHALDVPWATAAARLMQAEAAAATGDAAGASTALREAHALATQLGAAPLVAEAEGLSRRTRLSLEAPSVVVVDEDSARDLGLTAREAEVLGRVAAGETNRQIAAALFVSEKTVSVHVSNILRKLGVRTRVDAAAVAQRLGLDAATLEPPRI